MAQPHHLAQHSHRSVGHSIYSLCTCSLTCLATICCLPCICTIGSAVGIKHLYRKAKTYERPKTRERKYRERRQKEKERRTPYKLEERDFGSVLTLPLPGLVPEVTELHILDAKMMAEASRDLEVRRVMRTESQVMSSFFQLPLEIRRLVYRELLGGYVFHIYFRQAYRKMNATRCKTLDPDICKSDSCRNIFKVQGAKDAWGNVGLLPILMSCRRVYSEAIDILYKCNTFDFDTLQTVLQFSMTVRPERMHLIQSVQWKKSSFSSTWHYEPPWSECTRHPGCGCAICIAGEIDMDYALVMYGAL